MIPPPVSSYFTSVLCAHFPSEVEFLSPLIPVTKYVEISISCSALRITLEDEKFNEMVRLSSWCAKGAYETYHEKYEFQVPQFIYRPIEKSERESGVVTIKIGMKERKKEVEKKPKLGSGKRFEKLEKSIAKKGNVDNPAAVAAAIGRKKYGSKKMAAMSAAGRKRAP